MFLTGSTTLVVVSLGVRYKIDCCDVVRKPVKVGALEYTSMLKTAGLACRIAGSNVKVDDFHGSSYLTVNSR